MSRPAQNMPSTTPPAPKPSGASTPTLPLDDASRRAAAWLKVKALEGPLPETLRDLLSDRRFTSKVRGPARGELAYRVFFSIDETAMNALLDGTAKRLNAERSNG